MQSSAHTMSVGSDQIITATICLLAIQVEAAFSAFQTTDLSVSPYSVVFSPG